VPICDIVSSIIHWGWAPMAPACEPDNVRLLTPMWPLNYGSVTSRLAASIRQTEVSLSLSHAGFAT
jgi:hypothetical protein